MFPNYIARLVVVAGLVVLAVAGVVYLAIGRAPHADFVGGYSGICLQSTSSSSCPSGIPGVYPGSCADKRDNDSDGRIDMADTDCAPSCPIRQEGVPCQYSSGGNSSGGSGGGGGSGRGRP